MPQFIQKQMKIRVRFEDGTQRADAEEFLKSLGLDPERLLDEQTFDTEGRGPASIFGMPLPLDAEELAGAETWICSIYEQEGSKRLEINGQLLAARVLPDHEIQSVVSALPQSLSRLSLAYLTVTSVHEFVEELPNLTALNLSTCRYLKDLSGLSGLSKLTTLDMGWCNFLNDLTVLSDLRQLTSLELSRSHSLKTLSGINNLSQLSKLVLTGCESLVNAEDLSALNHLTELHMGGCQSITHVKFLSKSLHLRVLSLNGCRNIMDFEGIQYLNKLEHLDLSYTSFSNISWINRLSDLRCLELEFCHNLSDIDGIEKLKKITNLNLLHCHLMAHELTPLSALTELSILKVGPTRASFDTLACLSKISELSIGGARAIKNLDIVANFKNLINLSIRHCNNLVDVKGVKKLEALQSLSITDCERLECISSLGSLHEVKRLNLSDCESIRSISPLGSCKNLEEIDITGINRLRSIEPLRELHRLCRLESTFHPAVVAELLVHTAVLRSDKGHISEKSGDWLQEAIAFTDGEKLEQERFAATLGEAFSLLGEHDIVPRYESFLDSHPEFSAIPWKAWLLGCAKYHGHEVLVQRVERVAAALLSPGAVGGICVSLPCDDSQPSRQDWARRWLEQMEYSWQTRAKQLLPVSAEVCLAYARLGMTEALKRWLDRFTDPSDPAALDPVQAALGKWQLDHAQIESAIEHAAAVQQPATRDPLLAAIVEASYLQAASRAGEVLLMIESEALRGELAVRLVEEAAFAASAVNMERLIVACGHSVESLARLVAHAAPEADAAHLEALSEKLKQSPQAAKDLQRTLSLKLLTELSI